MEMDRSDSVVEEIPAWIATQCSMLVVAMLRQGAMRFSELHRSLDVGSRRSLAVVLGQLERNGLVERSRVPGGSYVRYELTRLGASLPARISAMEDWVARHRDLLKRAREQFATARAGAS